MRDWPMCRAEIGKGAERRHLETENSPSKLGSGVNHLNQGRSGFFLPVTIRTLVLVASAV
jgi:hypothetical protein